MPYPETRVFLIEPTDRARVGLRCYASESTCPASGMGYHDAMTWIGTTSMRDVPDPRDDAPDPEPLPQGHPGWALLCHERGHYHWAFGGPTDVPRSDPRWPTTCACGRAFEPSDVWQVFHEPIYRRVDTGEPTTLRDAPPGAMWNADWMPSAWKAADCRSLVVKCPNGAEWTIDAHARNCGSPCATCGVAYRDHDYKKCAGYRDSRPEHKCWVRHGEPPNVTVDKDGVTCDAGAGSIQARDYHGFLRGGVFTAG